MRKEEKTVVKMNGNWEKVNAVTKQCRGEFFDVYKHKSGVLANRVGIGDQLVMTLKNYKIYCEWEREHRSIPRKIKVIRCTACGDVFSNLTPGSEHDVIPSPPGENSMYGVWVMGNGSPVMLLDQEYEIIQS